MRGEAGYPAAPIRTERLILRSWREEDRAPFAALNADPEVREHFPGTLTAAESDALVDVIVAHWAERGWGPWAVEVPGVAPFIGFVGLMVTDHLGEPMVEVGWRLARRCWGRGYASEGAREALRFGFRGLGLAEIVSFTVPHNLRSRRVMERIGMRRAPWLDFDHPRVDPVAYPHLVRHVVYLATREEWEPVPSGEASPAD
ncbi:MAG TPA: GNAT family N-acetyltransferase [candidate division Zixibacteria bacterium]|nr:GNAT family N-acetyltransferase [candidate division Zixibacteria bacterium]